MRHKRMLIELSTYDDSGSENDYDLKVFGNKKQVKREINRLGILGIGYQLFYRKHPRCSILIDSVSKKCQQWKGSRWVPYRIGRF